VQLLPGQQLPCYLRLSFERKGFGEQRQRRWAAAELAAGQRVGWKAQTARSLATGEQTAELGRIVAAEVGSTVAAEVGSTVAAEVGRTVAAAGKTVVPGWGWVRWRMFGQHCSEGLRLCVA